MNKLTGLTSLQSELDRCVMCGMCSQFCPTYSLTLDENESPRGRIALISAVEKGQLPVSDKLVAHLEHCTYCRACENYCPSGVRFGVIMDKAKAKITGQHPQPQHEQRLQHILANPEKTRQLGRWLGRYQRWGLQRLMRASGLLSLTKYSQGEKLLPRIPDIPAQPVYSPAINKHRGDVALFTGCISSIMDRQTLDASRRILNLLGYGVYIPTGQTCCGALHQHSGDSEQAVKLAKTNITLFNDLDIKAILHTSTGCTSFLKEYDQLSETGEGSNNNATTFAHKVEDIVHFVLGSNWLEELPVKSLPKRLVIHEPCSARNVLHQADETYTFLEKIPDVELLPLPGNQQCCGAAGLQLLSKSAFAVQLQQNKVNALAGLIRGDKQPFTKASVPAIETLVTTNIGCALHLAAGLREQDINIEVIHPVSLFMRQIDFEEACTSTQTSAKVMT